MEKWFSKKVYIVNRISAKEVMTNYFSEGYFEACAEIKYILKNSNHKNHKSKNHKSNDYFNDEHDFNNDDFNDYDSTDDDYYYDEKFMKL